MYTIGYTDDTVDEYNLGNNAPIFTQSKFTNQVSSTSAYTLQINATDIDGDTINYYSNNSNFPIDVNTGLITKITNVVGLYNISLNISDGTNYTIDWIAINLTNLAPSITFVNTTIGATTTTCNYYNASDNEGDTIYFTYKWYNNSVLTSLTTATIVNTNIKYNQSLNCSVTPYDIYSNGTSKYSTAIWGNQTFIVNVYDITTGTLINLSTTFLLSSNSSTSSYTFNRTSTITNLSNGIYSYSVAITGYTTEVSSVTIPLNTTITLDIYMTNSSYTTIFTIQDSDTSDTIDGANILIQKYISLVLTTVKTTLSDITGRAEFTYIPSTTYYFTVSKLGYTTKQFNLNPIVFATYFIKLDKSSSITDESDFVGVQVLHSPTDFTNGINTVTVSILNPDNQLVLYGYNISYPNSVTTDSGAIGTGEEFVQLINIVGGVNQSEVNLSIYYQLSGGVLKTFTYQYHMVVNAAVGTFIYNKNHTYGMGVLERVLLVTLFVILVAGMASYFGSPILGGLIGVMLFGYFSYIGLISWVLLLIPIFGFVIVSVAMRSQQ
jgi:hypothetical protein